MTDEKDQVIVGRFGRPHGLKGYISVYSFTHPVSNILTYSDWNVMFRGNRVLLKPLSFEQHARFFVALIEGYQDRDLASQLTNLDIFIRADQFPPLHSGEFYWHELVGMTVVNTQGVTLGTVTEMLETGSNDVLVVTGDTRCLIPYRPGVVVISVCQDKRQIIVDWDNEYL